MINCLRSFDVVEKMTVILLILAEPDQGHSRLSRNVVIPFPKFFK